MANDSETKQSIQEAIQNFSSGDLGRNAIALFNALGYNTQRQNPLANKTFDGFKDVWGDIATGIHCEKAFVQRWLYIDFLFQLTEMEVADQSDLFNTQKVDDKIYESYLFFAIELGKQDKGDFSYTRTELAQITREMNKLFKMPVMVLFKYSGNLTLSIINRRLHKKDESRDVLEKVTLIKDVSITSPNRAHTEILFDLSYFKLKKISTITSFVKLHEAWRSILNIKHLNDKFYDEIAAWFAWASQTIKLPFTPAYLVERYLGKMSDKPEGAKRLAEEENVRAFNVRLLCRMIFLWFMKERKLVAPSLLELSDMTGHRVCLFDDTPTGYAFLNHNGYYRGILQNIFFNCLNTKQDERKQNAVEREHDKWAKDDIAKKVRYRGKKYLPPGFEYAKWFDVIPYLNGGLFDKLEEDCASDEYSDDVISVPNSLFYARESDGFLIGEGKAIKKVRGLNTILSDYKFTIEENTPLEEDVALDPELLGMVFENLLASLDSNDADAAKAARKASGSFYTPRRVVDYMCTESLRLYLESWMRKQAPQHIHKIAPLVYHNTTESADAEFADKVVTALDHIKILDPACGSGAFPMGMLQKMNSILQAVDEDNTLWLEHQVRRLPQELHEAARIELKRHATNYARKHGIIRNAIHGVDILPMAATITKLRFFISLLVEQHVDFSAPNYGLSALPNLETKIICANTLTDTQADMLADSAISHYLEAREKYFKPGTSHDERERLANAIAESLAQLYPHFDEQVFGNSLPDAESSRQRNIRCLRDWFLHANVAAPFFDMKAFFPEARAAGGFDIVIGNPPYGGTNIDPVVREKLDLGSNDPYGAFIARFLGNGCQPAEDAGVQPLKKDGVLSYIVSDTFMTIKSHHKLRKQILCNRIHKMIRVARDTFGATVNTAIVLLQKQQIPGSLRLEQYIPEDQTCQMVDLTNVSIHDEYDRFIELLFSTAQKTSGCISNESCAVYHYPQRLIATNSNYPFFVSSPKLFALMRDVGNEVRVTETKLPNVAFNVVLNEQGMKFYKLGDNYTGSGRTRQWLGQGLTRITSGIKTGRNKLFIRSTIVDADDYPHEPPSSVLANNEACSLPDSEKRDGIINGKKFVWFEMGLPSDAGSGLLPVYGQPPPHLCINWSAEAVAMMRAEPHSDLANPSFRFLNPDRQISFSITGEYAPTFRLSNTPVYVDKASRITLEENIDGSVLIALLNSKLARMIYKTYISTSPDVCVDDIKELPVLLILPSELQKHVKLILQKQCVNPRYDYASNEQLEIDRLVYEAYGLNDADIAEVETWYARRYAKLATAQRQNLRAAGKLPPAGDYRFYCDESCHLPLDGHRFMILGTVYCPERRAPSLTYRLRQKMKAAGWSLKSELKWTKVSKGKMPLYKSAIDFFFDTPELHFTAIIALKKDHGMPKPPKDATEEWFEQTINTCLDARDHWNDAYYESYVELLRLAISPVSCGSLRSNGEKCIRKHRIFLDVKDTQGRTRVKELKTRLDDPLYDFSRECVDCELQHIESHHVLVNQIADLLIGAVSFRKRYNDSQGSANKNELIGYIEERLGRKLLDPVPPGDYKFVLRHGKEAISHAE